MNQSAFYYSISKGKLIWFDPGCGYNIPGEIIDISKNRASVKVNLNGKIIVYQVEEKSRIFARILLPEEGINDMITMSDLNEASILWNIKIRYDHRQIYTYIGSILIAVNPYCMYDIYNMQYIQKYEDYLIINSLPAYFDFTSKVNRSESKLITEQILEANPLLESFGNAKTVRNDNSSRFGKYIEVYYSQKVIIGAEISEYLLEKSRIVTHSQDERNYHVFYEMLAGLPIDDKRKYGLSNPEKYFYLNQGGNCTILTKNDANDFQSLLNAMKILGFTRIEQETIFKILAAVLHLGNIYFTHALDDPGHDIIQISTKSEVEWAAHLLSLNEQGLLQKLTHKVTEARDERLLTPFNLDQALDS
ncbi:unnamed protein product, partial [Didymodactylos carnosus]